MFKKKITDISLCISQLCCLYQQGKDNTRQAMYVTLMWVGAATVAV